ncbi:MAG: hypothetical protein JO149_05910 [Gammaproteobacteria bacterium]|nr:hypothetical protein [Gammaproteobacteria bacterium]
MVKILEPMPEPNQATQINNRDFAESEPTLLDCIELFDDCTDETYSIK